MQVGVVFLRRSANYTGQGREPRFCVFGPRIIPPSILPSNDHFLHLFPPAAGMDANEIVHPTDCAREAHPNEHVRGYGHVRQGRQSRDGIEYSPISIYQLSGRFSVTVLHSQSDNIGRELAKCLDAEFEPAGIVKLTERGTYGRSILLCTCASLSQAARRKWTRGFGRRRQSAPASKIVPTILSNSRAP
jgi:hypothetical protein